MTACDALSGRLSKVAQVMAEPKMQIGILWSCFRFFKVVALLIFCRETTYARSLQLEVIKNTYSIFPYRLLPTLIALIQKREDSKSTARLPRWDKTTTNNN